MDFSLNEEQEMFRNYVRKYLEDLEGTNVARDVIKGNLKSLKDSYKGLSELGCTAINIPESHGGLGLGELNLVPVFEEIGRVLLPSMYPESLAFAVPLLKKYGTDAQKEKYLKSIAQGDRNITLAWIEPKRGYNHTEVTFKAVLNDNNIQLNGVKTLVPNGDQADTYILVVRTNEQEGKEGLSLIIVDRSEEIEVRKLNGMDESQSLAELTMNNLEIPRDSILGKEGEGWDLLEEGLLHLNASLSSMMVGAMDEVVQMATAYAKMREQFNQPIGRFQAIKHRIVDMKLDLETARSLSHYANWAVDSDAEDKVEAVYSARAFITTAYKEIASHNIQIHGGIGFTEEIDCHLYLKRATYYENYLGSVIDHHEKIVKAINKEAAMIS